MGVLKVWNGTAWEDVGGLSGELVSAHEAAYHGRKGCCAYSSVSTSIPNDTTIFVPMDVEVWDVGGYHDLVTNNSRFTVPAGEGGWYSMAVQFGFSGGTAGASSAGGREIDVRKNAGGIDVYPGGRRMQTDVHLLAGTSGPFGSMYGEFELVAGDFLNVAMTNTAGGAGVTGHALATLRRIY